MKKFTLLFVLLFGANISFGQYLDYSDRLEWSEIQKGAFPGPAQSKVLDDSSGVVVLCNEYGSKHIKLVSHELDDFSFINTARINIEQAFDQDYLGIYRVDGKIYVLTKKQVKRESLLEVYAHLLDVRMLTFADPPIKLAVFEQKFFLGEDLFELSFSNDGKIIMLRYFGEITIDGNIHFQAVTFSGDWSKLSKYELELNVSSIRFERSECWIDDDGRPYLLGFIRTSRKDSLKGTALEGAKCVYRLFAFLSENQQPKEFLFELEVGKYVSSISRGSLIEDELFFIGYYSTSKIDFHAGFCYFLLNKDDFSIVRKEFSSFTSDLTGYAKGEKSKWESISQKKRYADSFFGLNFPDNSRLLIGETKVAMAGTAQLGDLLGVFINSDGDFERADLLHYGSDLKLMRGYVRYGYDDEQIYAIYTIPRKAFFSRMNVEKSKYSLPWIPVMKSINRHGESQLYVLSDLSVKDKRYVDMRFSTRLLNGQLLFFFIDSSSYSFAILDLTDIPKIFKG